MMKAINNKIPTKIKILSAAAIFFGILTIKSGGSVLFIDGLDRVEAGNYVPIILWFNFFAGFFYIAGGVAVLLNIRVGQYIANSLLAITLIMFAYLGFHILTGGLYEPRTLIAMIIRISFWALASILLFKQINQN